MPEKQPDGTFIEVIDDVEFRFQLWGAQKALEVGLQLAAIVSGPVEALGSTLSGANEKDELRMGPVIGALFASMGTHRKDAMDVIKNLVTVGVECMHPGETLRRVTSLDTEFRGRLSHLRKVVQAAAEVQFGDFFGDIAGAFAQEKQAQLRNRDRAKKNSQPSLDGLPSPA